MTTLFGEPIATRTELVVHHDPATSSFQWGIRCTDAVTGDELWVCAHLGKREDQLGPALARALLELRRVLVGEHAHDSAG